LFKKKVNFHKWRKFEFTRYMSSPRLAKGGRGSEWTLNLGFFSIRKQYYRKVNQNCKGCDFYSAFRCNLKE